MYYVFLMALCVALSKPAIAQNANPVVGARANGTGYTSSCLSDGWSVLNNPGGLSAIRQIQAGVTYERISGFPSFNRMSAIIAAPLKTGAGGVGVFRFGDDLYSEQAVTLAYGNRFGLASLGVGARYIQLRTEGFGTRSLFSFSMGGIADLSEWLSVGALIINGIQADITDDEKISALLLAGIAVKPTENVTAFAEIEKDIAYDPLTKIGVAYAVYTRFTARAGINVSPGAAFGGFGFSHNRLRVDYAFSWYTTWPSVHQASISYLLPEKK